MINWGIRIINQKLHAPNVTYILKNSLDFGLQAVGVRIELRVDTIAT